MPDRQEGWRWIASLVVISLFAGSRCDAQGHHNTIRDLLVVHLQSSSFIHSPNEVLDLYKNTGYSPIWTSKKSIDELINAIKNCHTDGLDAFDYHYELLTRIHQDGSDTSLADILLSDAFLTFSKHLRQGRLSPTELFPSDWDPVAKQYDLVVDLLQSLSDENIAGVLESQKPKDALYCRLKQELQELESASAPNDSVNEYKVKVLVNMEKCRWLPENLTSRLLRINIPTFELMLLERDSCMMYMKAIVGRPERKTPVLNSLVTSMIVNPEWTVPPTILREDILPSIQKNNNYLKQNNLRLIDHDGLVVQPDSLPWSSYNSSNFPFIIRQDPGVRNALGLIKFHFANRHGVYMHDTNIRMLFSQNSRALSSGCIRIEKPFALAAYLLKGTGWDENRLQDKVKDGVTTSIELIERIPVQTVYFTIYIGQAGELLQAADIYDWDSVIARRLKLQAGRTLNSLNRDSK